MKQTSYVWALAVFEFAVCIFPHRGLGFWVIKRSDECDLAGVFTDIVLTKKVSQSITHFFKQQLLADKLRMSKCDVKFKGCC